MRYKACLVVVNNGDRANDCHPVIRIGVAGSMLHTLLATCRMLASLTLWAQQALPYFVGRIAAVAGVKGCKVWDKLFGACLSGFGVMQ